MVLSHGNAAVEGGFSINKELLNDNMLEETVVAQRVVFDAIRKAGMYIKNVDITLNMGMTAAHCQGISECLESGHPVRTDDPERLISGVVF